MRKPLRMSAEEQFAATQKKVDRAVAEKEQATNERAEHVATLKARRLVKEAADKEAAIAVAEAKANKIAKKAKA